MSVFPFFSLSFGLCLMELKSIQAGETCVGIRRSDSSYDFNLPDAVAVNAQEEDCDAAWTADQEHTAVLDGNSVYFDHPFKTVTRHGITLFYCPTSLTFHVSCPKYVNDFTCSCVNYTNSNTDFSTTIPLTDISSSSFNEKRTGSSGRKIYGIIAAVATFSLILVILGFLVCRTNRYATTRSSADANMQPGSVEVT